MKRVITKKILIAVTVATILYLPALFIVLIMGLASPDVRSGDVSFIIPVIVLSSPVITLAAGWIFYRMGKYTLGFLIAILPFVLWFIYVFNMMFFNL